MEYIESVVIIKTPFHFFLFQRIIVDNNPPAKVLVLTNLDIYKAKSLNKNPNFIFEIIPKGDLFIKKLLKNPFRELRKIKLLMLHYSEFSAGLQRDYISPKTIYIFNDKDVFTQYYIYKIGETSIPKVIAIEEGTSFYLKETFIDAIYKKVYRLLSVFLLGFNYSYVGTYGSSYFVDTLYLRFPEYFPGKYKSKKKSIIKINLHSDKVKIDPSSTKILLLSSPLMEYMVLKNDLEIKVWNDILKYSFERNYKVYLKPHPKENLSKFGNLHHQNIVVIQQDIAFEELDLSSYKAIVNYASSAILDAYEKNYPTRNIVTINPYKKHLCLHKLYEETNYLLLHSTSRQKPYKEIWEFVFRCLDKIMQQ